MPDKLRERGYLDRFLAAVPECPTQTTIEEPDPMRILPGDDVPLDDGQVVSGLAMQERPPTEITFPTLKAIKAAHTIVWALFAGCIFAIPVASWRGEHRAAAWLAAIVAGEVAVLVLNKWRCPLTSVAARYTDDRRENFDIYLPEWLARYNKLIFGALYVAGVVFALARWARASS